MVEPATATGVAVRCFLATFRPLVQSAGGRRAANEHGLPPFIDGSCRREPDFESRFPSITASCRAGAFAPRLRKGDRVAYISVKGRYLGEAEAGWRLVAVLKVAERFESHELASEWYDLQGCPLPSNCVVEGNPPRPFHLTNGRPPADVAKRIDGTRDPATAIRLWDATYRGRVTRWPVFLACESEFLELVSPRQLHRDQMIAVFGRIPGTLNPPEIACGQLDQLLQLGTV
jgi:hypothetical protein